MAGMVNADSVATQLEVVTTDVPIAYERDSTFLSMLEARGSEQDVSSRALRVVTQVRPGGRFRQTSFDNGDLGRGGASQYLVSTLTPIDFVFAVELSKKVEISTNSRKKAVVDVVARETASAMAQARTAFDIVAQGASTGILGTVSNVAGTVLTISGNTGVAWFYIGMGVNAYTSSLATQRVGTAVIQQIDPVAKTVTLDILPAGTIATDVLVIEGLAAGAGLSQTLYGLQYHASSSSSGTWQGVARGSYPEVRAIEYASGGAALALPFLRLVLNKMAKVLGVDFAKGDGLQIWAPLEQKHAYEDIAQGVIILDKSGGADQSFDGAFNISKMVGLPVKYGIHADPTRVDFMRLKTYGRAVSMPLGYYKVPGGDGQTRFPVIGSSGGLQATAIWYLGASFQIFNTNPRANGFVSGLAVPTGY
jgi:hypothetical protein